MTLLSDFKRFFENSRLDVDDELATPQPVLAPAGEAALPAEPDAADARTASIHRLVQVTTGILILMSFYTVYISAPVLIPVTIAVLISMLLAPFMTVFDSMKLPRPLGAAILMAAVVIGLAAGAYALSGPARDWLQRLPQSGAKIDAMLRSFKEPFAQIQQATEEIASTAMANRPNTPQRVQVATPGLTERLLGGGAQFAAGVSVVFVLVYFLLSAGDTFLRKLVSVIPSFRDKKRTVDIIRSIESDISFYLVMMLVINAGLGLGVAAITAVLGIPDPLLWGALTLTLSFAPYIGELAIAITLFVVSMVTFDTLGNALIAPAAYVVLMSSVHLVVPFIVRRRLLLNPVAIFVAIIFLGWIWGVPGALLAVPLLASLKTICERVDQLNPIAAFLTP
jgi:predicted PurR-regulated permease PerM